MQSSLQINMILQVSGMTAGRAAAMLPVAVGLISAITGALALRAANRAGSGKRGAIVTLVVALVGIVLSVLHIARSSGGIGTGSGKLGAIVALVLGVTGAVLGWMALSRSKRIANGQP